MIGDARANPYPGTQERCPKPIQSPPVTMKALPYPLHKPILEASNLWGCAFGSEGLGLRVPEPETGGLGFRRSALSRAWVGRLEASGFGVDGVGTGGT